MNNQRIEVGSTVMFAEGGTRLGTVTLIDEYGLIYVLFEGGSTPFPYTRKMLVIVEAAK